MFAILDMDGSGSISHDELRTCLELVKIQPREEELTAWIKEVDINLDGEIDIVEFIAVSARFKRLSGCSVFSLKLPSIFDWNLRPIASASYMVGSHAPTAKRPAFARPFLTIKK